MKTALITGGAKGIGLAISQELMRDGWNVVITGRDAQAIDAAVAGLTTGAGKAVGKVMDVRDRASIDAVLAEVRKEFDSLDSLINCAGVIIRDESEVLSEADWETVIDTDLSGVFRCSQAAFADLEKAKGATIVNVGSIAGSVGIAGRAGYTAAKAGLEGLTRTLGLEWADRDIRVNAVAPSLVATPMAARAAQNPEIAGFTKRKQPFAPNQLSADQVAAAYVYLIENQGVTGQIIEVDGGWSVNSGV